MESLFHFCFSNLLQNEFSGIWGDTVLRTIVQVYQSWCFGKKSSQLWTENLVSFNYKLQTTWIMWRKRTEVWQPSPVLTPLIAAAWNLLIHNSPGSLLTETGGPQIEVNLRSEPKGQGCCSVTGCFPRTHKAQSSILITTKKSSMVCKMNLIRLNWGKM